MDNLKYETVITGWPASDESDFEPPGKLVVSQIGETMNGPLMGIGLHRTVRGKRVETSGVCLSLEQARELLQSALERLLDGTNV